MRLQNPIPGNHRSFSQTLRQRGERAHLAGALLRLVDVLLDHSLPLLTRTGREMYGLVQIGQ